VWSLCVEEQFYLLFPVAVALIALRPSPKKAAACFVALLVGGMAVRGYLWLSQISHPPFDLSGDPDPLSYMTRLYYPSWSRLDGLLAGIVVATIRAFRPELWDKLTATPNLLLVIGTCSVAGTIFFFGAQIAGFAPAVLGYPLLSASMAIIVMAGSDPRSLIGRYRIPGAAALATGAYSIYLSQKIACHALQSQLIPSFGLGGISLFVLSILVAMLVGAALYWAIERPFLTLRDRMSGVSRTSIAA
jgi:peptidoglycan/LPS O-acetylase OafA/YrhL